MQTFFEKLLTGLLDALPHILWALVAFFVGLAIANGIVALSGALLAQYQGSSDINMGRGAIVIGLAAVIIGRFPARHSYRQHHHPHRRRRCGHWAGTQGQFIQFRIWHDPSLHPPV